MSKRTPAQIDLLERVADQIEIEPRLWQQRAFTSQVVCGTAHCIGGWAVALAGKRGLTEAGKLLGLTSDEWDFVFYNGFNHNDSRYGETSHKEVAEWLRGIARGEDVFETAPEWWTVWGNERR